MTFKCKKCRQEFYNNYSLQRHIATSLSCRDKDKASKIAYIKCEHCLREFSRIDSLKEHIKLNRCPVLKITNNTTTTRVTNGNSTVGNNNNSINGDNNINGNYNNSINGDNNTVNSPITINVLLPTNGGYDHKSKDVIKYIDKGGNLLLNMIESINLNPNKPENHNILYTNMRSAYGMAYLENGWTTQKIALLIDALILGKSADLTNIDNTADYLNAKYKKKIKYTVEDLKKPESIKSLISHIKPILYDNREMIMKTFEQTKNHHPITSQKEMATYLLDNSHILDKMSIQYIIDNESNIYRLKTINQMLLISWYSDIIITNDTIQERIELNANIAKLIRTS
jgi:hypothetical protein